MKRSLWLLVCAVTVLGLSGCPSNQSSIWYVTENGSGSGTSWSSAFGSIQDAVDAASSSGGEVWVAAGTYSVGKKDGASYVVEMAKGVSLYGGFAGTETTRDARNWETNVTIIDGGGAYTCVSGANNATLDGFTIQNGYASTYGGGMDNESVSPTVSNCIFTGNYAEYYGGAIENYQCSPTIKDCTFTYNSAQGTADYPSYGGAIDNDTSSAVISGCVFGGNAAELGGAIAEDTSVDGGASSSSISGCGFVENEADYGGAVDVYASSTSLVNCLFVGNISYGDAGAVENEGGATTTLTNCTFTENTAQNNSGAMDVYYSTPVVTNCIFWGDTASGFASEIDITDGAKGEKRGSAKTVASSVTVRYSCVEGGYAGSGNINANPLFFDSSNGDYSLESSSPCIDAGTSSGAPDTDIDGITRPQGGGYDMGAFEYTSGKGAR